MDDDSVFFLQDTVDIPLSRLLTDDQEEVADPRESQQFCLQVHERKKRFLSKFNEIPHKLLVSDKEEDNTHPLHSNVHNFEMINYPRDTPFFSLHGPGYNEVAGYFDPRRTKTEDILGQTIYQQQVFLDVQEEIPATNDVSFESFFSDFVVGQGIDLPPLNLENISKEDGKPSQTLTQTPVSPKDSIPATETTSPPVKKPKLLGQDDLDDYRDLLIDVLVTRNPIRMSSTLKTSNVLKKALNSATAKDVPQGGCSNGNQSLMNSFVDEKSVVREKSPTSTPKVPITVKNPSLLRLASDPNHSFIDEFDRSLQPSLSSTPKSRSNNSLSKRKKTDKPKTNSPKMSVNKPSCEQLNKRQKVYKASSVERSSSENDSLQSPNLKGTTCTPPQSKIVDEIPKTSVDSQKIVKLSNGDTVGDQNMAELKMINEEITQKEKTQPQPVKVSEPEVKDKAEKTKTSPTVPAESCEEASAPVQPKIIVEENSVVETCKTVPLVYAKDAAASSSCIASSEGMESSLSRKENCPAKKSVSDHADAATVTNKQSSSTVSSPIISENKVPGNIPGNIPENTQQSLFGVLRDIQVPDKYPKNNTIKEVDPKTSKKLYSRDVCNAKDVLFYNMLKGNGSKKGDYQNEKDSKLDGGSHSLLDAGLMSIRQIKGIDQQSPIPTSHDSNSPSSDDVIMSGQQNPTDISAEKLKRLAFKDRAIGQQLMKYCCCWVEETKHSTCVDLYGEFLVTINNRFRQQLDMSIVNAALSVLSRNSDRVKPDNFFLKTALFTTELLKVLTHNNQTF